MLMQKFPLRKMFQPLIFYTRRLRKPWRTRRAEPLQGEFGCLRQFTVILHNAKKLELRKGLPSGGHFPVLLKRDKLNKMKLILLLLISCLALHSTKGKSTIKSTLCLFFFLPGLMSQYTLSGQVVEETTSGHVYHPDSLSAFREHPHIESHWESQGPRGFLIDKQKIGTVPLHWYTTLRQHTVITVSLYDSFNQSRVLRISIPSSWALDFKTPIKSNIYI